MRSTNACLALTSIVMSGAVPATTVYTNDFDNPPTVASGVSAAFDAGGGGLQSTVAPYTANGSLFRNDTLGLTTLTLSNLPAHSTVDIGFLTAFLDSWDSTDGSVAPDFLNLYIDGNPFAQYTYNNASGTVKAIGGGTVVAEYTQYDTNFFYSDSVVDMSNAPELSFAHSGSTLTVGWQAAGAGYQGRGDESWGIDDLRVDVEGTAVPLPPGVVMFVSGLALLFATSRRSEA